MAQSLRDGGIAEEVANDRKIVGIFIDGLSFLIGSPNNIFIDDGAAAVAVQEDRDPRWTN